MLDLYYAKEQPLPLDEPALFRLLIVRGPDETAAARQVLEEFFQRTDAGWVSELCDNEIEVYRKGAAKSAADGRAKASKTADKSIRAHARAKDAVQARGILLDFVRRHGADDAIGAHALTPSRTSN